MHSSNSILPKGIKKNLDIFEGELIYDEKLIDALDRECYKLLLIGALQIIIYRYYGNECEKIRVGFDNNEIDIEFLIKKDTTIKELLNYNRDILNGRNFVDIPDNKKVYLSFSKYKLEKGFIDQESIALESDLNFYINLKEKSRNITLIYNKNFYTREQIIRMKKHLEILINQLADNKKNNMAISELNFFSDIETCILTKLTTQISQYPKSKSISELFDQQVKNNGSNIALRFNGNELSYEDLNKKVNKLARYITKHNSINKIIGVSMQRSTEMIISILAIIKAGYGYVPLDPQYPKERLKFIVDDTKVNLIITNKEHIKLFDSYLGNFICYDTEKEIDFESEDDLGYYGNSEEIVYVAYTSGSTGFPKGVQITHKGILRLVLNTNFIEYTPNETFLQISPIAFDVSLFEIFGSLLNGARLVIYPPESPNINEVAKIVLENKVTVLWLISGLFNQIDENNLKKIRGLNYLIAGGDVISVQQVIKAKSFLSNTKIINGYGPTENTTFTCCHVVDENSFKLTSIPIGIPVSNTKVYVFDNNMLQTPIDIAGTLYVGGDGLSKGYLNREEINNEKFIINPLNNDEIIYNTGDIVHVSIDGNLIYHGRVDNQVKIRGYRIELGEIEYFLEKHEGIKQAVVKVKTLQNNHKKLLAYLILEESSIYKEEELKEYLKRNFPSYMVPSQFVLVDEFPLNSNGKVEKHALPEPNYDINSNNIIHPKTKKEKEIINIIKSVVEINQIGINENLFSLGADSLQATEIILQVNQLYNCNISIKEFLINPCVSSLVKLIDISVTDEDKFKIKQLSRGNKGGIFE